MFKIEILKEKVVIITKDLSKEEKPIDNAMIYDKKNLSTIKIVVRSQIGKGGMLCEIKTEGDKTRNIIEFCDEAQYLDSDYDKTEKLITLFFFIG